jgi:hypothetical protein
MGLNNGTLENGASFALGAVGDAFSFNGNNQYVLVGDPIPTSLQIQNSITMSAWIYVTAYPSSSNTSNISVIVGSQRDATASGATMFYDGRTSPNGFYGVPPGHITFQFGDGSNWYYAETNTQVPLNQWTLVTAAQSANSPAQIYYNGVLQPSGSGGTGSPTWNGTISYNSAWFAIGQQKDENRPFNGLIDEVQVYNRALTAAEVQAIYNSSNTGVCASGLAAATSLTSSANPAATGALVTFTATVSPGTATGSVTFTDGGTALGAPVALSGGQATYSTTTLAAGSHTIMAVYSGDTTFSASSSAPLNQYVFVAQPQSGGLVAWWPGEGNANDVVGPDSATLYGGASYVAGRVGQAFSFDGSTGYVEKASPDSSLNVRTQSWTVSAWVQTSYSGGAVQEVVARYAGQWNGSYPDYEIWLGGDGKANFYIRDNSDNYANPVGTSNLRDGAWHLVTGVLDRSSGQASIYVDGVVANSVSASSIGDINDAGSPLDIGAYYSWGGHAGYFNGSIDEVQIYNRALSTAEIQGMYIAGSNGARQCSVQPTGLVSWWRAEGNANDYLDTNNAVANGGVSYVAGEVGEAFSFDGSSGYVEETNPDTSLNIRNQSWTASAWVQSSYSGTATQEIVSRYACGWDCSSGNSALYEFWLDSSGRASFEVRDTGGNDVATTGKSNLRDGAWHLVTGVLDRSGAQLSIYVDGALQNSANASALGDVNDSGSPLEIGRLFRQGWASPIAYFNGLIDEVQVYNRALSASEVLGIYNAGSTGVCHN